MPPDSQRKHPAARGGAEPRGDCPRCGLPTLVPTRVAAAEVLRCQRCLGSFVSRAEAPALRESFPEVGGLDRRRLAEVRRAAAARNLGDGIRYLACPACGERMERRQFALGSGLVVDRCVAHGVWFDGGELELAAAYFAAGGPLDASQRRGAPQTEPGAPLDASDPALRPIVDLLLWLM